MYALVANGYVGIVQSYRRLNILTSIYPYPKFRKVRNKEEAYKFIERNRRGFYTSDIDNYGDTSKIGGYGTVSYIINNGELYVNIHTEKLGFIRIRPRDDVELDCRPSLVKFRISNLNLNDDSIQHHCIAIARILDTVGDYVDLNIVVPDISVYLALTKYTGKNYIIRRVRTQLNERLGGVSITIR